MLLTNLPEKNKQNCNQFFSFLCVFFDEIFSADQSSANLKEYKINFNSQIYKLIGVLSNHKSGETSIQSKPDRILIGIMRLVEKILASQPELKRSLV